MKSRWEQVESLFHLASGMAGAEREQFLRDQCGSDEDLKQQVQALLEANTASDRLEQAIAQEAKSVLADFEPGDHFGPYELQQALGRGGMGTVYRAKRKIDDAEQVVAIKLIQSHLRAEEWVARFRRERKILASLEHPNIARLLDGGSLEGRPFLVMEYVEGLPIDQHCQNRGHNTKEILQLVQRVCEAVHYAHGKLIVHRDIKPQNILVTADGIPKLLDFGIAKPLEEEESLTSASARMLTPHYAAPEQILGRQVTTGTDVYGLGALLYKLFSGKGPFERPDLTGFELERAVCEMDPRPLKSLATVDDDLDAIVSKALRKEVRQRYSSVKDLQQDLEKFCSGYPVDARKGNWTYRTGKFLRRRSGRIAAALLVGISLTIGVVSTRLQQLKAERRFGEVRELANRFLFEFHDSIANLPGSTPARKLVVSRALEYLQRLEQESEGDTGLLIELAEAYKRVQELQYSSNAAHLNDVEGAIRSGRRALAIRKQLHEAAPLDGLRLSAFAEANLHLGDILASTKGLEEAKPHFAAARQLYAERARREPNTKRQLEEEDRVLWREASLYASAGKAEEAVATAKKAVEIAEALTRTESNPQRRINLGHRLMQLGDVLSLTANRPLESIPHFESARENYSLGSAAYRNPLRQREDYGQVMARIGLAYAIAREHKRALPYRREALRISEEVAQSDPGNEQAVRDLGIAYINACQNEYKVGNRAESVVLARKMVALFEKLWTNNRDNASAVSDYTAAMEDLADYLVRTSPKAEPFELMQRAISLRKDIVKRYPERGVFRSHLAHAVAQLGDFHAIWNDLSAANQQYAEALAIYAELEKEGRLNGLDESDRKRARERFEKTKSGQKPF